MRTKKDILGDTPLPLFLLQCRTDFKFFCEKCLGVTDFGGIHEFQLKWFHLANKHKRLVIEAPAGHSKSEVMGAMFPIWLMLTSSNLKILLINKTLEQGKANLLARIKNYISNNGLLMDIFTPDDYRATWNQSEIKTKNGHWVKNVPYNENIRGYRAHLIIGDEVDTYEDTNIFFEHVVSRLFPNGSMILISTPVGPTRLIGQLKERSKAGLIDKYHFEKTTSLIDDKGNNATVDHQSDIKNYHAIWPEMWSVTKLYEAWGEQGKANWMRNYMVECLGEIDDAMFPIKNILNSFDYNRGFDRFMNPQAMYFIAADFAISDGPKADFDAFIVVEKINDQYIVKSMETHKGWQRPEKVNRLFELYQQYESPMGTFMVVDESNMGTMVMNDLRNRGIPVVGQKFHTSARKKLITTLGSIFAGKGIVIPRSPDAQDDCVRYSELLKEQLIGFRRKRSDKTGDELIESRAAHDDLAICLAMAMNEAVQHAEMDCMPISG
jgi:phage terminase large subunit-like protein